MFRTKRAIGELQQRVSDLEKRRLDDLADLYKLNDALWRTYKAQLVVIGDQVNNGVNRGEIIALSERIAELQTVRAPGRVVRSSRPTTKQRRKRR